MSDTLDNPTLPRGVPAFNNPKNKLRNTLITFLGAGLVLATFIWKENLRDDAKDRLASIENAEGVFLIRAENRSNSVEMQQLRSKLDSIGGEVHLGPSWWMKRPSSKTESDWHMIELDLAEVEEDIPFVRESVDNLSVMIERAGEQKEGLAKQVKELQERIGRLEADEKSTQTSMQRQTRASLPGLRQRSGVLEDEGVEIWKEADTLDKEALRRTRSEKEEVKRELSRDTIITNVLFGLGWAIALIGRLFSIDGLKELP
jgi:hypothetical protein